MMVGSTSAEPTVSIIVPARNEAAYIARCLSDLLEQDYPRVVEILVFDGCSEDGTRRIAADFQQRHPMIQLIDNPARAQTVAFNKGIQMARGRIVVFASAHTSYDKGFVSQAVRVLQGQKLAAAALGSACVDERWATTPIARAIIVAHRSRFGIGVAKFRRGEWEGWADTGFVGCYWRDLVIQVGGFREELLRTDDLELCSRLRAIGRGIYLSSKIKTYYTPRTTLRDLWRQNFGNGMAVMQTWFVNCKALAFRHLIPFAFVLNLLGGFLLAPISWLGKVWLALVAIPYLAGVAFFSFYDGLRHRSSCIPLMPIVFVTIHLSYGMGSIWGLFKSLYRKVRFGDVNIFGVEASAQFCVDSETRFK